MTGNSVVGSWASGQATAAPGVPAAASWTSTYLRHAVLADAACGLTAGLLAYAIRLDNHYTGRVLYLTLSVLLPVLWLVVVAMFGGYDSRFIGVGSEEFRRVLNSGVFLMAAVAFVSYALKADLARGYVVIALPTLTGLDLVSRFALRKQLHRGRRDGHFMRKVVVVGHAAVVADLAAMLRRDTYHGLSVASCCIAGLGSSEAPYGLSAELEQAGIDVVHLTDGLDDVLAAVKRSGADTVAVLPYPEMTGIQLRELAWRLEKTETDLCVAPTLLDVAGPRTTIRPVAGLPLLHMDHPEFTGPHQLIKAGFDRAAACAGLLICSPLLLVVAAAVRFRDGGPVLFRQVRVGKNGRHFTLYKFRTMVLDAEEQRRRLGGLNENDGLLFKIREDPRVTRVGALLRRWSLDELPQLVNVLIGDMSLVGPRPALPEEAALYGDYVRRRLMVRPGMTGLWQVNGRSDLKWDESVRLDLSYVENWSFMLDVQILWKTWSAVVRGSGAY